MPRNPAILKVPVKFLGYSKGDETASLGVTIERTAVDADAGHALAMAERLLCNRRLNCRLVRGRRNDGETQGKMFEGDTIVVGNFDTGKLGVTRKAFGTKLSARLADIDHHVMSDLAKCDGFLTINSVEELKEDPGPTPLLDGEGDEDAEEEGDSESDADESALDLNDPPPAKKPRKKKAK